MPVVLLYGENASMACTVTAPPQFIRDSKAIAVLVTDSTLRRVIRRQALSHQGCRSDHGRNDQEPQGCGCACAVVHPWVRSWTSHLAGGPDSGSPASPGSCAYTCDLSEAWGVAQGARTQGDGS